MVQKIKLGIIGAGVMGEAIVQSLISGGIIDARQIMISDPQSRRLAFLKKRYKIKTSVHNLELVESAKVVLLAIKPQNASQVFTELKSKIHKSKLVVSIMAGVPLRKIKQGLGVKKIVRSMPNTPAQIGQGMTVWLATSEVSGRQKALARQIFSSLGQELEVKKEDLINVATALSGSGPAYLFLIMEALVKAGQELNLPRLESQKLISQTFKGALALIEETQEDLAALRKKVTSKGGTTEAALKTFLEGRLDKTLIAGLKAAYQRAKELS